MIGFCIVAVGTAVAVVNVAVLVSAAVAVCSETNYVYNVRLILAYTIV